MTSLRPLVYGVQLIHWGWMTHICVNKLTIIDSDNGLSPDRRQATIWTNAGILLIGPLETNFSEIRIEIHTSSVKIMHLKMSGKLAPFCLSLIVLTQVEDSLTLCKNRMKILHNDVTICKCFPTLLTSNVENFSISLRTNPVELGCFLCC